MKGFKKVICLIFIFTLCACPFSLEKQTGSHKVFAESEVQIGAEGADVTAKIEEIDGKVTLVISGNGVIADDPFKVVSGEVPTYILYEVSSYYEPLNDQKTNTLLTYINSDSLSYTDCRNVLVRFGVEKLVIEEGVTAIGKCAFYGMLKLSEVELPETLTTISNFAFLSCPSLKDVKVPSSVKNKSNDAFSYTTFGNYKDMKRVNTGVTEATSVLNEGVDPFIKVKLTGMHYFEDFAIINVVDNYTKDLNKIVVMPADGDYSYNKLIIKTMFTNSNIVLILGIALIVIIDIIVFIIVAKKRKKNKKA